MTGKRVIVCCALAAGLLLRLPFAGGAEETAGPTAMEEGEAVFQLSSGDVSAESVPSQSPAVEEAAGPLQTAEKTPEEGIPDAPSAETAGNELGATSADVPVSAGSEQLARKLFEIEVASRVAEEELGKLPSLVQSERTKIANELNQWANTDLRRIIDQHYLEVEKALAETTLPEDHSSVGIWWKQVKAGVFLNEEIEEVVALFVKRAGPRLSTVHEEFQRTLLESLEQRSQTLLRRSMEEIRTPFVATVKDRLPLYNAIPVPNTERAALSIALSGEQSDRGRLSSGMAVIGGVVLTVLGRKLVQKMMHLAVVKIGGKVLSRMIPIIGVGLLLYEGIQMGQAKEAFEEELRKSFFTEYTADVTVESVWNASPDGTLPSMKQEMERNINTLLSDWERICRSEAVSMIHSAQVLASSEHVRNYVSGELEKGADFQLLLQKINALWDAFGQSLALEPVEFFESILIDSPDRNDLRLLSRDPGSRFIELYKEWGAEFLKAVNKIGVENYVSTEWKTSDVNWSVLNRSLDFLPDISGNRNAARGLLFLIQEGVPLDGFSPDLMAKIAVKKDVFLKVWQALTPDARKLAVIFESGRPLVILEPSLIAFPEACSLFLRDYGVEFWTSWSSDDIFDLLRISEIRGKNSGKLRAASVLPEERADLLEIYRRSGERGIILWDIHTKEPTGEIGRKLARQSIACMAEGYPFEDMKDPEFVRFAAATLNFPAGRFFYDTLKGVGSLVRYLLLGGVLLLFGGVFFGLFKRFRGAFFSPPSRYTIKEGTEKTERKALKDVFADDERADGGGADETASFTVEPEMIEDPEISPAETDDATGKEEDLQEEDAVSADEELQRGQSDEESAGTAGKSTRQRRRKKRMKKENE